MTPITPIVYSLPDCPKCDQLKSYLTSHDISYSEASLENKLNVIDLMFVGADLKAAPLLKIGSRIYNASDLFAGGSVHIPELQA